MLNAALDPDDEEGDAVILQTAPQEAKREYDVYAGVEIKICTITRS